MTLLKRNQECPVCEIPLERWDEVMVFASIEDGEAGSLVLDDGADNRTLVHTRCVLQYLRDAERLSDRDE